MKNDYLITPYIADAALFETFEDANDHALLFNLATMENLHASCHLNGYQQTSKYRIRVAHVRGPEERAVFETIGWISTERAVER